MQIVDRKDKLPASRMKLVEYAIILSFLGLAWGLWQLQILHYARYALLAQQNRIRSEPIPAPRGRIYDRRGRLLVDNYPSFTVYLLRDGAGNWRGDLAAIATGLQVPLQQLQAQVQHYQAAPIYQPIPLKADITVMDESFLAAHRDQYPELETLMVSRRLYPKNGFAANLIGYVGEPTAAQLASGALRPGSLVGKSGLEAYYNRQLMGRDGERRVMVDSRGRVVGTLSDRPPVAGQDLHLTLDENIQMSAETALGDRPGAVVALDPRTGAVLAMVSRPTFDPNLFVAGLTAKQWQQWSSDPGHPLLNKAIQAQLAPGSVFKLVTAVAGLQENIAETKRVDCTGLFDYHGHLFHCWIYASTHAGHGEIGVQAAITHSCDVYFYTLGAQLGIATLDKYALALGLGQRTGIDLPQEAVGLVPTPAWKEAHFHQPWYAGETIPVAIGQGALTVTPIQLARLAGGIASGGHFPRPHLLAGAVNNAGFNFPLTPVTVATITAGMRGVVEPGGTAASAQLQGVDFGGKTGTAQTISLQHFHQLGGATRRQYIDNAWFVGISPVLDPHIAVCVLYQRGAEGSYAGRIAARVIETYYQEEKTQALQRSALSPALSPALAAGGAGARTLTRQGGSEARSAAGLGPAPRK
ncbi:MAG: penicillin-binding protein 2 [Terriglobales bacterium]